MCEQKKLISGGMGFGYGSKYQLLRMLGWHRNYLNDQISNVIGCEKNICWLDFEFAGPEDKEIINARFLSENLENKWENIWPTNRGKSGINWDAIGIVDGNYVLVEAKAHIAECGSGSKLGGGTNPDKAIESIDRFMNKYKINSKVNWLEAQYYQLANRLIFTDFLRQEGVGANLIYVLFINGYEFNTSDGDCKSVKNEEEWVKKFDKLMTDMGVKGTDAEKLIDYCYIDCNPIKS